MSMIFHPENGYLDDPSILASMPVPSQTEHGEFISCLRYVPMDDGTVATIPVVLRRYYGFDDDMYAAEYGIQGIILNNTYYSLYNDDSQKSPTSQSSYRQLRDSIIDAITDRVLELVATIDLSSDTYNHNYCYNYCYSVADKKLSGKPAIESAHDYVRESVSGDASNYSFVQLVQYMTSEHDFVEHEAQAIFHNNEGSYKNHLHTLQHVQELIDTAPDEVKEKSSIFNTLHSLFNNGKKSVTFVLDDGSEVKMRLERDMYDSIYGSGNNLYVKDFMYNDRLGLGIDMRNNTERTHVQSVKFNGKPVWERTK